LLVLSPSLKNLMSPSVGDLSDGSGHGRRRFTNKNMQ